MPDEKAKSTSTEKLGLARKGRVKQFIYTNEQGLVPVSKFKKSKIKKDKEGKSQQIDDATEKFLTDNELIKRPFDVSNMITLQENCSFFDATVRQIAEDVVGAGWDIVAREEKTDEQGNSDESYQQKVKKETEAANLFFEEPNKNRDSLEKILKAAVIDWGVIGAMAFEISRTDKGINGIYHIPAETIYIKKADEAYQVFAYCQKRGMDKKRWFTPFGADYYIDKNTGKKTSNSKQKANELIYIPNYYKRSKFYGAPNALSAVRAIYGLINVSDYNLSFFENYGVPAALVTLEGEWEEGSVQYIRNFLDTEIRGTDNAHRTMVLEAPLGVGGEAKGSIVWKPLVTDVKEGSFTVYYKELRDQILVPYRMPPYQIGIAEVGSLGGSTAKESKQIYRDSVLVPLQNEVADFLTRDILWNGKNLTNIKLQFRKMDLRDKDAMAKRHEKYFSMGGITRNEIRAELGKKPVEDEQGDEYYISNKFVPIAEVGGMAGLAMTRDAEAEENLKDEIKELISQGNK